MRTIKDLLLELFKIKEIPYNYNLKDTKYKTNTNNPADIINWLNTKRRPTYSMLEIEHNEEFVVFGQSYLMDKLNNFIGDAAFLNNTISGIFIKNIYDFIEHIKERDNKIENFLK